MTGKSISFFKFEALKVGNFSEQDVQMLAKIHASFVNYWKLGHSFRSVNEKLNTFGQLVLDNLNLKWSVSYF